MKYIFVTGGVLSSLGKGLFCGSLGSLLMLHGKRIKIQKFDPYFNTDPGNMSPYQHGEVYVLSDGAHTDLDLGHYERFSGLTFSKINSVSSGQIYKQVILNGENGVYNGQTVQVIPHVTNEIIHCLNKGTEDCDITIVELGGTIGDIEGLPYLEAFRQFHYSEKGRGNCIFIMLSYVPYLSAAKEIKTKPTYQAVAKLREIGIYPDIIVTRSDVHIGEDNRKKLSFYCSVDTVIEEVNVPLSIYEIPQILHDYDLDIAVLRKLGLSYYETIDMSYWKMVCDRLANPRRTLKLAICGYYLNHFDAHKSTYEAITHAGIFNECKIELIKLDPVQCTGPAEISELLAGCTGVLIPDGYGSYGLEGMINMLKYCRENYIKTFAFGLGMQLMVIEYCRNVLGLQKATSEEFAGEDRYVLVLKSMNKFKSENQLPHERAGQYTTYLAVGSIAMAAYGAETVAERHRYFFEVDFEIMVKCEQKGLLFTGKTYKYGFGDICEVKDHVFMLGAIYRPQFQSKPAAANPMFAHFIKCLLE